MREWFRRFACAASAAAGTAWAFLGALALVLVWAASGPLMAYSEMWQLTINTTTTIITFLMVFLIQSTQNRDAKSMELKLDELIRAVKGARTRLVRLEELSDDELEALRREFDAIHERLAGKRAGAPPPERAS
jgi:low affinity Fe/Cu permease